MSVRPPLRVAERAGVASVNRDTERFAEFVARDRPRSFLDVGTGTGYLAIRLALDGARVAATDLSPRAAALAERNARVHGVALDVAVGDLFAAVEGTYEAVAFNPPFSAGGDPLVVTWLKKLVCRVEPVERLLMHHMPGGVERFRRSLVGRFLDEGRAHLEPGGAFYLLLYRQDLPGLDAERRGLEVAWYAPPPVARRNLVFARCTPVRT